MSNEHPRKIYTLADLPPEVKAVTFAKCSRSPKSFKEIAAELTEEKSAEFHEKWVVGYGHSSVAEHAVLSIAMENVSILATKVIEDTRLASYTEQSTRYQLYDRNRYYKPREIISSEFASLYEAVGNFLFDTYLSLSEKVISFVKVKNPKKPDQPEKMYETICKAGVCDIIRHLLPIATLTNLGTTINARSLEHMIRKLLSHPLSEMQEIGKEIKEVARNITPTLIKYADYNAYLAETRQVLPPMASEVLDIKEIRDTEAVTLVRYDKDVEDRIACAILYGASKFSYQQIQAKVKKMSKVQKEKIIDAALNKMSKHDWPIREFEHTYYTFDILINYGAFRDIQRHRICTQTNQAITCDYGYDLPEDIVEAGYEKEFKDCMAKAEDAYHKIAKKFPLEAQYIIPLAYRKRVLYTWNLRELFHFIKLRSGKRGHPAYRRIAQKIYDEIAKVHPFLAKYITVDKSKA